VFPRSKLCAGGVGGWSASVLEHLAIDLHFPHLLINDVEFRFGKQKWTYQTPVPFRMVQRTDFDTTLVRSAVDRGLVFHENEQFIEAKRAGDGLAVATSRGQYYLKALVGADGALSKVRRAMMPPHRACLAATLQVSSPADPKYDPEFTRKKMTIDLSPIAEGLQGYTWHFPCLRYGEPFMNHGIGNFRIFPDRTPVGMKRLFHRELRDRNIQDAPGAWSSHPIRWFSHDTPIGRSNVILVGDAAGNEPAFGGGIPMALSYGEIAAKSLIQAFQTGDFSFRHYKDGLLSHFLGRHIADCTRLASKIYGAQDDPLRLIRQFFAGRFGKRDLLSLLLRPKRA
jgi:flavin-dependent dehydrogenase